MTKQQAHLNSEKGLQDNAAIKFYGAHDCECEPNYVCLKCSALAKGHFASSIARLNEQGYMTGSSLTEAGKNLLRSLR